MITNYARRTEEIESRIVMTKAAFNQNKAFFVSKQDLKFKEETSKMLDFQHSFVWC